MSDLDLRLLTSASSEVEAMMWQELLEQAGIHVLVRAGGPGAGAWASAATFAHDLFVRADQLEMARAVLHNASDRAPVRARRRAPRANPRAKSTHGNP